MGKELSSYQVITIRSIGLSTVKTYRDVLQFVFARLASTLFGLPLREKL